MPEDNEAVNLEVSISGNTTSENGDSEMTEAIDLPPNVTGMILKSGSEAFQQGMTDIQANASHIHNVTRGSVFRKFDEIGVAESRSNSGLIATPIASPTTGG